ncbi:MAG: hypothetical protein JWL65_7142 [Gammaproteobacteria bacterium]|nr:hypothetical protein [Gammaproteobacteria bacterium]
MYQRFLVIALLPGLVVAQSPPSSPPASAPPALTGQGQGPPTEEQAYALVANATPPLPPNAPQPAADPHDLQGTWFHDQPLIFRITKDEYGKKLPYSPKGQRILDRRVKATYQDGTPYANASAACLPPGQQWQLDLNMPFQLYQRRNEIDFLFEEYHGAWKIRMNQPHRTSGPREYMGDSVGHWDGSTLVVDTTGYKLPLWLDVDGTPASRNAHIVHRIRKIEYGVPKLEITTTIDDPEMYTAPWSNVRTFAWRPDMARFHEYNCEHQVGAPGGVSRYGLTTEPPEE